MGIHTRGIQCHTNTTSSYIRAPSDYGWNTNRNSNDIHPASPGCRPGTYPLIEEEAEEELQNKQTSLSHHDHRTTCTCNCCCSNMWATRTQQSHSRVSKLSKPLGKEKVYKWAAASAKRDEVASLRIIRARREVKAIGCEINHDH